MMKIFLNPGHTPQSDIDAGLDWDVGACGCGLQENIVCKQVSDLIEQECQKVGIEVVGNFQSMSLYAITDTANATDADILVSIHCNAASPAAEGTETFYCQGSSTGRKIAECVQKEIIAAMGTVDRGVKDDTQTQHGRIHVLRQSDMPAILIELAFISNEGDASLLRNNQADFARAIVKGLCNYGGITPAIEVKEVEITVTNNFSADIDKISVLARKYESNGDPACVANNPGDLGGISYGLYQFASKVGVVDKFVNWLCNYSDEALANYGRVLAAYPVNSTEFIETWKDLGTVDPGNFGRLQDEYIKAQYYDVAASKLAKEHFDLNKHTNALKAVVLSRAVQNGPTGCVNLFDIACGKLGHPNLSYIDDSWFDGDLIGAVYDFLINESDLARPDSKGIWRSPDDFCHGSKGIIDSLRNRFVRERADALAMLTGGFCNENS